VHTVNGGAPTTFSYDSDDRLLSDGVANYAWDANGNLVTKTQGGSTTQYGYDAEDQLISIEGGGLSDQYAYDADGNRVQAITAAGTTQFLVDEFNPSGLSQVLEEKDGGGVLQARYSYGAGLLAMVRGGSTAFRMSDAFGSTGALANTAGAITDQYQYDAYGNAVSAVGSTVNAYRYRGERLDADSGLYQLRARSYSPAQGRFMTRDQFSGRTEVPGSLHRYMYANADPVNRIDPSGRESLLELISVQAGEAALDVAEELPEAIAARCAAMGTAEQASVAIEVAGLGLGLVSTLGGLAGGANTTESGYVSPDIPGNGLKNVAFKLKTGGGVKGEFTTGFAFHSGVTVEGKVGWPPLEFGANFKDAVEWTIYRIRYCYVPLGTLVAKLEDSRGVASKGAGAYRVRSLTGALELSLFHGALTFGLPLFEAKEEARQGSFSLFGGAFGLTWPSPAK
jgi:RHS repeat-associated protein